jgi:uncharacterized membrane protein YuzA (DUF378 family)
MRWSTFSWICFVLVIIGGLNWGLVGFFDFNLVSAIFGAGSFLTRFIFILVGLSAVYLAVVSFASRGERG